LSGLSPPGIIAAPRFLDKGCLLVSAAYALQFHQLGNCIRLLLELQKTDRRENLGDFDIGMVLSHGACG
jgi:hypothetical protein